MRATLRVVDTNTNSAAPPPIKQVDCPHCGAKLGWVSGDAATRQRYAPHYVICGQCERACTIDATGTAS